MLHVVLTASYRCTLDLSEGACNFGLQSTDAHTHAVLAQAHRVSRATQHSHALEATGAPHCLLQATVLEEAGNQETGKCLAAFFRGSAAVLAVCWEAARRMAGHRIALDRQAPAAQPAPACLHPP